VVVDSRYDLPIQLARDQLKSIFKVGKAIIGMLHSPPLPGSPENTADLTAIKQTAAYKKC
jgi:hypothetical protein